MSKRISLSSIAVAALWLVAGSLLVVEPSPPLWAAAPGAPAVATALSDQGSTQTTTKSSAKDGRLAIEILPDLNDLVSSPCLAASVPPFLNEQSDARSGAEQVSASRQ